MSDVVPILDDGLSAAHEQRQAVNGLTENGNRHAGTISNMEHEISVSAQMSNVGCGMWVLLYLSVGR